MRPLFVLCCIAFGMLNIGEGQRAWGAGRPLSIGYEGKRVALEHQVPTEFAYMFRGAGEYISVSYPAPQINIFSDCNSIGNVLCRNCRLRHRWRECAMMIDIWRQKPGLFAVRLVVEHMSGRVRGIPDLTLRVNLDTYCSGVTAISPSRPEPPAICSIGIKRPESHVTGWEHKRGFIGDQRLLSEASLAICNRSQDNCEHGYDERGNGGDSGVVGDDVIAQTVAISPAMIDSNGETLIRAGILGAALGGAYAPLIRL